MISKEQGVTATNFNSASDYLTVMYDGYSVLPVSFECAFEEPSYQNCSEAVKINIHQVKLPPTTKAYTADGDEASDKKFVKKKAFEDLLTTIKNTQK
jgi:hypothetical protein